VSLHSAFTAVDGRNAAPPNMYAILQIMEYSFPASIGAGFFHQQ